MKYFFHFQAMVRGDLEILQDWCYEAVSVFIYQTSETTL